MTWVIKMKYYIKFLVSFFLLCGLIATMLSSCKKKPESASFTVGALNGPSGLSLVKLMQDSLEGLDQSANYIIKNDPELIKAMMIREEVELALVPFTMGALLYNNDLPYQLVGVPVWGSLFLVGSDISIEKIGDLKGKTIHGLPRNMTPDIVFRHILSKNEVDPGLDVDIQYTFPTPIELASALQADRISLAVLPKPLVSRILNQNPNLLVIFDLAELWHEIYDQTPLAQTALMVRTSWAQEHPELLLQWCDKYAKAIQWTNAHTAEAGRLAFYHNLAKDSVVVAKAIPGCRLRFQYGFEQKAALTSYLQLLHSINSKIIGNRIPDEHFFYTK